MQFAGWKWGLRASGLSIMPWCLHSATNWLFSKVLPTPCYECDCGRSENLQGYDREPPRSMLTSRELMQSFLVRGDKAFLGQTLNFCYFDGVSCMMMICYNRFVKDYLWVNCKVRMAFGYGGKKNPESIRTRECKGGIMSVSTCRLIRTICVWDVYIFLKARGRSSWKCSIIMTFWKFPGSFRNPGTKV